MLIHIPEYKNSPEYTVQTFTAYSLGVLLGLNAKGFKHIGLTTDRFNGLMLTGKHDIKPINGENAASYFL